MNNDQIRAWGRLQAKSPDQFHPPAKILAPAGTAHIIQHVRRQAILEAPVADSADPVQSIYEWATSAEGFEFAADSVRRELANGNLRAIALNGADGHSIDINERFWRGAEGYEAIRSGTLDSEAWLSATGTFLNNSFSESRDQPGYIFVVEDSKILDATMNGTPPEMPNTQTPLKRGRPESVSREELLEHLCFCLTLEDLPSTQSDFFKMILTRYSEKGIKEPSQETLRKKLGALFHELQKSQQTR